MSNFLVRFVKRGHVWEQRQMIVLCNSHIINTRLRGNAVVELCESVYECISCTFEKKVKKAK